MDNQDNQLEQNKREEPVSILSRSLLTGFIGGLIGGFFGVVLYYFNFSEVAPRSYVFRSWLTADWIDTWLGTVLSILVIGVISLGSALIYFMLFKKINTLWMGAVYGILLWVIVFYLLQPIFPNIPHVMDLKSDTIVSTICLYILYGTFIGYSISYDYNETLNKMKNREEQK
ncbi:YqhR family membrane protein [Lentibacillus amyloliquefaciens]|uniref:Membrane protein YqhR n=1 Tax=Lentibacillus amyloliquefaciens TaxID=1472767 RepID=A0A0U3NMR7_9BACI|nr:YqhR family membrane protein [Lentibacillus amyloliquefaciens]ALX48059.1 hypothetical protein AOX59_05215 [Lentibacillus amyloliquefaciens]